MTWIAVSENELTASNISRHRPGLCVIEQGPAKSSHCCDVVWLSSVGPVLHGLPLALLMKRNSVFQTTSLFSATEHSYWHPHTFRGIADVSVYSSTAKPRWTQLKADRISLKALTLPDRELKAPPAVGRLPPPFFIPLIFIIHLDQIKHSFMPDSLCLVNAKGRVICLLFGFHVVASWPTMRFPLSSYTAPNPVQKIKDFGAWAGTWLAGWMYMANRIFREWEMGAQPLVEFISERGSLKIFRDSFGNKCRPQGMGRDQGLHL